MLHKAINLILILFKFAENTSKEHVFATYSYYDTEYAILSDAYMRRLPSSRLVRPININL